MDRHPDAAEPADLAAYGLVPLEGGHSGETFLAEAAGERSVVRIYAHRSASRGDDAVEVDAAVLRLVHGLLPAPEVLETRRPDARTGTPGLMVTSFLRGSGSSSACPICPSRSGAPSPASSATCSAGSR